MFSKREIREGRFLYELIGDESQECTVDFGERKKKPSSFKKTDVYFSHATVATKKLRRLLAIFPKNNLLQFAKKHFFRKLSHDRLCSWQCRDFESLRYLQVQQQDEEELEERDATVA